MIKKLMEFGVIAEGAKMIAADHVANKIFKDYYYNHQNEFGDVNVTSLGFVSKALAAHLVTLDLEEIIQYDTWEKCCSLIKTMLHLDAPTTNKPKKLKLFPKSKKDAIKELLTRTWEYAETNCSDNGKYPLDIRVTRFDEYGYWDNWCDKEIFTLDEFEKLYDFIKDSYSFDCEIYVNFENEAVTTDCGVMFNYNKENK